MKISFKPQNIAAKAKEAPKKIVSAANDLGSHATTFAKKTCDSFTSSKPIQALTKKGISKKTFIGTGIAAAALASAVTIGLAVKNKVQESKDAIKE